MYLYKKPMTKAVLLLIFTLLLGACKGTKSVVGGEVDPGLSARQLIGNHYDRQSGFKTLSGRIKIDYSNGKDSQGFNVSLRMEKDKVIWISGPLGVIKAMISPDRVTFYNKLQNEYFDGDFSYLSELLGTELDFDKVQNILLGQAMMDLREERYRVDVVGNTYELTPRNPGELFKKLFLLEPRYFRLAAQQISQPLARRELRASYTYQDILGRPLPEEIHIVAEEQGEVNIISLGFRNLELNRPLNFPYEIPKGYDKITLK